MARQFVGILWESFPKIEYILGRMAEVLLKQWAGYRKHESASFWEESELMTC